MKSDFSAFFPSLERILFQCLVTWLTVVGILRIIEIVQSFFLMDFIVEFFRSFMYLPNSTDLTSSFLFLANLIALVIQFPLLERPRPRPFSNLLWQVYVLFCFLFYYSKPDKIPIVIGYTEQEDTQIDCRQVIVIILVCY